jgi:hypothetical protein
MRVKYSVSLFLVIILSLSGTFEAYAQTSSDTINIPQITIESLNGFGPYTIGTSRDNFFMAYDLPTNTSSVTFRMIDENGDQINSSSTTEGDNLESAFWEFESDTMNFPLSPQLNVVVHYQTDSVANYYIPYLVYCDTIFFEATKGWGPFITNNYTRSDTSWHNVPQVSNTFKAYNFPPRAASVKFTIFSSDSIGIDSLKVDAQPGNYLDSAKFVNVRMDLLPLNTRYIEVAVFCEGGPEDGVVRNKDLLILPQTPKLLCKTDLNIYHDSIPQFTQNQTGGQAIMVDTNKYAQIQNGPGLMHETLSGTKYAGPYSFDIIQGQFTIEVWVQYNAKLSTLPQGEMIIMSVDSLWKIGLIKDGYGNNLYFYSLAGGIENTLVMAGLPSITNNSWHHLAYTFKYIQDKATYSVHVFWDGNPINPSQVSVDAEEFDYIFQHIAYRDNMKTKPLILGSVQNDAPSVRIIQAMDEVRIWNYARSAQEIKSNFKKPVLQDLSLTGYWNFDDLRTRLKIVSDDSYTNNTGTIENGACFIPEAIDIQDLNDTIIVTSSNKLTDSIRFSFYDFNNNVLYSKLLHPAGSKCTLAYDLSLLSYKVSHLKTREYFPGVADSGFVTKYNVSVMPPIPIATPKYNWSAFYQSDYEYDEIINSIDVAGLPSGSFKIVCGLKSGNSYYDTQTFTQNSVPYQYSLNLNGADNFIQTSQKISCPTSGEISFYFNTTSKDGGVLLSFSQTKNGVGSTRTERLFLLEKDGSVRFQVMSGYVLYGEHAYNDGQWHNVTGTFGGLSAELYVDGSLVDHKSIPYLTGYDGYWLVGRNHANKSEEIRALAEYYKGSLAEIYFWRSDKNRSETLYRLDDGQGVTVLDSKGSNHGTLSGNLQKWVKVNRNLSYITWKGNMINKPAGNYTFFVELFYEGGPANGIYYPIGNFIIKDPLPGYTFDYNFNQGIGYFNEGVFLNNLISFFTDYTLQGTTHWKEDFLQGVFLSPSHNVISKKIFTYTQTNQYFNLVFDMGDAAPGSYFSFQNGFITTTGDTSVQHTFSVPVYINQMIAPTVSGDYGPFLQAIAPGCMDQENTFTIATEELNDMNKVIGKFYDNTGILVDQKNAVKLNDTTWHLTYDMGKLPPPQANLKIEYYLGQAAEPALIEGPYQIIIHKTRPRWFDFMADSCFHNVQESGDEITFTLLTYLSEENRTVKTSTFKVPKGVPILGETNITTGTPTVEVYLKFIKSLNKLEIDEAPVFSKSLFIFELGPPEIVNVNFQLDEENSYDLDENNDLFATQNFASALDMTWSIKRLVENPVTKMMELYKDLKMKNWKDAKPIGMTANFTVTPNVGYASRLHYSVDTINGGWGSVGNLKIDANPDHEEAYKNSASYHFVYMGMDCELSLGVTFGGGLVDVYGAVAPGIYIGMGSSYIDIPKKDKHFIMSAMFQTYYRVYLTALWSWYEVNLFGPNPICRLSIGADNMTDCFPPFGKSANLPIENFKGDLALGKTLNQMAPVGWYQKMPLPLPQHSISMKDKHRLFTWLEPEKSYGERNLCLRNINPATGKFGKTQAVTTNQNAIQKPSVEMINDNIAVSTWMQTRHTPETFLNAKSDDVIETLAQSQDIWYSVFDINTGATLLSGPLDDNTKSTNSGRAEANPEIVVLSDNRALIVWQVADFGQNTSDIWYAFIDNTNGQWTETTPQVLAEPGGTQTNLKVASPAENVAVIVWKNFDQLTWEGNRLMTSVFASETWTNPTEIFAADTLLNYNYFDLDFENGRGAMVYTTYTSDQSISENEILSIIKWDFSLNSWDVASNRQLYSETDDHIQVPRLTISKDGKTAVGFKLENLGLHTADKRISQVDILLGDISDIGGQWQHFPANPLVCDTTKQVNDFDLAFAGGDTLMILSHEFIMAATNVPYEPFNGITFGDPVMNLVFRAFKVSESGEVEDVNENHFFGLSEVPHPYKDVVLEQNYPNPCSDFTNLKFHLPDQNLVRIEIFNLIGSKIGTIADANLDPGSYELALDTSSLESGTYIIRLTSNQVVKSIKMMVNK